MVGITAHLSNQSNSLLTSYNKLQYVAPSDIGRTKFNRFEEIDLNTAPQSIEN